MTVEQIYQQYIKPIPAAEQLELIQQSHPQRSLLELEGLGAEIWQDVEAQQYDNDLRNEWNYRACL